MEFIIYLYKDPTKFRGVIENRGKIKDSVYFHSKGYFDNLLIYGIDRFFKKNKINPLFLNRAKTRGKFSKVSSSHKIAKTVVIALNPGEL